jgi:ribosome assembly protein 4
MTMFLWNPTVSKAPIVRMTGHQKGINFVTFSPDGRLIASASFDKVPCFQTVEYLRCC